MQMWTNINKKMLTLLQKDRGVGMIEVMIATILMSILAFTLTFVWTSSEKQQVLIDQNDEINDQTKKINFLLSFPLLCTKFLEIIDPDTKELEKFQDIDGTLNSIDGVDNIKGLVSSDTTNTPNSPFMGQPHHSRITSIRLEADATNTPIENTDDDDSIDTRRLIIKFVTIVFERMNGPWKGQTTKRQLAVHTRVDGNGVIQQCQTTSKEFLHISAFCKHLGGGANTNIAARLDGSYYCSLIDTTSDSLQRKEVYIYQLIDTAEINLEHWVGTPPKLHLGYIGHQYGYAVVKGIEIKTDELQIKTNILTMENLEDDDISGTITVDQVRDVSANTNQYNPRQFSEASIEHLSAEKLCLGDNTNQCRSWAEVQCPSGHYAYGIRRNGSLLCEPL